MLYTNLGSIAVRAQSSIKNKTKEAHNKLLKCKIKYPFSFVVLYK